MNVDLSESKGDHDVRVLEVLLEKVERLQNRVSGGELSAPVRARVPNDESYDKGAGI